MRKIYNIQIRCQLFAYLVNKLEVNFNFITTYNYFFYLSQFVFAWCISLACSGLDDDHTTQYLFIHVCCSIAITLRVMCLFSDSMEVKPATTRKLRRRPNDPMPIPEKRRKTSPSILYVL